MATLVFENIDNNLALQFKKFADSLGVGFKVFHKPVQTVPVEDFDNPKNPPKDDIMAYAGMFRGAWGETSEEVEKTIQELRKEW